MRKIRKLNSDEVYKRRYEVITIGVGTGRCGTKSLAKFLDKQPSSEVSHEFGKKLEWNKMDRELFLDRLRAFHADVGYKTRGGGYYLRGDVAPWYLPYIEAWVRESPPWMFGFKVVCLKRNREDTVESYRRHQRPGNTFQGTGTPWPEVDRAYPTYDKSFSMRQAIAKYWEMYYETAEWLSDMVDWFKIFELEELNHLEGQNDILDFLEYPAGERKYDFPHENRGNR